MKMKMREWKEFVCDKCKAKMQNKMSVIREHVLLDCPATKRTKQD